MAGPEVDPLQRLREEAQQLGGVIDEFDTTVNNKVAELYPQFLEGKSGDEFFQGAILLGETVRDTVGSRPLLEAQKRRLDWAIQIGELAEEGFFGDRRNEILGKAQETLYEVTLPPQPETSIPSVPVEAEAADTIEFLIGPIDYKGRENEVSTHPILKAQLDEYITLPNGQQLDISARKRELINIVRSLPDGMAVFKKSLIVALGISEPGLASALTETRESLRIHNYTIENATQVRSMEARYFWKQTEQQIREEAHDEDVLSVGEPIEPISGNGEVGIPVAPADAIEGTESEIEVNGEELGDEEAIRKLEELLEQNLAYLESHGLTARDLLLDRLPVIDSHELEKLSRYDRDEIEIMVGRLSTGRLDLNVDFNKIPLRIVQHLRFAAAFWTGRLQNYNPDLYEINYEMLRENIRDYLHLEIQYTKAYPWAENLPLLVVDLVQKVRDKVSEKKSGAYS